MDFEKSRDGGEKNIRLHLFEIRKKKSGRLKE
jgi:hypothetical protein